MKRHYTTEEKVLAVEIVARYGGEVSKEALSTIRAALDAATLNKTTVYRWLAKHSVATELQPIKKKAVELTEKKLDDVFEALARQLLKHAAKPDVISEMKGQQAITSAAIAVDKMRLLRDMPTEIVQLWPGLMTALDELGLTPAAVFESLIAQAAAEKKRLYDGGDQH